jgi:hypothetical protein
MLAKALIVVGVVLTLAATVTAQAEKPITDIKMLAGAWNGWYNPLRGGAPVRAQTIIKDDGSWSFHPSGLATTTGSIMLVDGKARYQASVGDPGTVVLIDKNGKDVLRFVRRDGTIASEFER